MRNFLPLDHLIIQADKLLRTASGHPPRSERLSPAAEVQQPKLDNQQQKLASRLMRVNHAGEIAAQALYQGQALTARDKKVVKQMQQSADEEYDHLNWCADRLKELNSHTSYLNPLWFTGSFAIGTLAGICGDRWSLGFLEETERQVVAHLEKHLEKLPTTDIKSRRILLQMQKDEALHAQKAQQAGAANLAWPIKLTMKILSKVMTTTAYYI